MGQVASCNCSYPACKLRLTAFTQCQANVNPCQKTPKLIKEILYQNTNMLKGQKQSSIHRFDCLQPISENILNITLLNVKARIACL